MLNSPLSSGWCWIILNSAMKIAIISDTHDNKEAAVRAARLAQEKGAEVMLHLGDIIAPFTPKFMLEHFKGRFIAVFGNNDGERPFLVKTLNSLGAEITPAPRVLELAGRKIIMMHEPFAVESIAKSGDFDIVAYGHTHELRNEKIGGTLLLNPGEACGYLTGKRTFMVVDLDTMEVEVVEF